MPGCPLGPQTLENMEGLGFLLAKRSGPDVLAQFAVVLVGCLLEGDRASQKKGML